MKSRLILKVVRKSNLIFISFYKMSKWLTTEITKSLKRYAELTKFKLSVLNGIVTVASYSLYTTPFSAFPLFASSIALSMSSQALNQYIEKDYDKLMIRTQNRPLVKGMNPNLALLNGIGLGAVGILGLYTYNPLTAALGVSIWAGYLFLYTAMKRKTQSNTFVGSIVGSLPVYLGWAASGRSICMVQPFALFVYMMAWQHQHFYGIRWIYYDDYNNAGFKMEKDKNIASAYVIVQTALTIVLVNYSIKYYQIANCFLLNIPLTLGLYRWGIKSALDFGQNKITPREFKKHSYIHFCLIFFVFLLCRIFGKSEKEDISASKRNRLVEGDEFDFYC